jgi:hypothetical protein
VSIVNILSEDDESAVLACADLVDHGSGKTAFKMAPWIRITNINMVGQPGQALQLAGRRYDLYVADIGQTCVGCVATALADPVHFLAIDIIDKEGNSVLE